MRVYDFDDTVFEGDSEYRFVDFIIERYPFLQKELDKKWHKYEIGQKRFILSKTLSRQRQYKFLKTLSDVDADLNEFWKMNIHHVKEWYKKQQKDDDVIISATPYFILKPVCDMLGIKNLIATDMDKNTGKIHGKFNWKNQKPKRFLKLYSVDDIDEFYSDSDNDKYMAKLAKKAYKVKGNEITDW